MLTVAPSCSLVLAEAQVALNITKSGVMLCYVMLCIFYLKSIHKIVYNEKLINSLVDATLTPGDQM